ncbi:MAG: hypothetical protein D6B26_04410, partial [Spirochaetaceae bacterium]
GYEYRLTETNRSAIMEGESRPGHYDGVLTVVMKLLLLTGANRAYFGEKDYQQYVLIQRMADAFFLADTIKTQIIMCPIIREADGLAMSSRNVRLSAAGRQQAARFPQILRSASNAHAAEEQLRQAGFRVDYVTDTDALAPTTQPAPTTQAAPTTQRRRFAAVFVEDVRLIDTMALSEVKHES